MIATDAPTTITRSDLEEVICGAHDAMILLDTVIDDLHGGIMHAEEWKTPISVEKLQNDGAYVVLLLTKDQYRALDVAKIHAFCATRAAENLFLNSAGAIE